MSRPVFYAHPLPEIGEYVLAGPEGRHAATVRRIRTGEELELVDGAGGVALATVASATKDTLTLHVSDCCREAGPQPRFVLVQALAKGDRGELAVELATEAGVDEIVPWRAQRCVTRWEGERGAKALDRWRSTAVAAAKQSRRGWWPVVAEPASTAEVATRLASARLAIVLHEEAGSSLADVALPDTGEIALVVGPEGGIGAEELAALGAPGYRLGPTVFRTSSAGAIAVAVLAARTARWR
jgi:16S rRNA (uracil1498-N3)-methyltransferase